MHRTCCVTVSRRSRPSWRQDQCCLRACCCVKPDKAPHRLSSPCWSSILRHVMGSPLNMNCAQQHGPNINCEDQSACSFRWPPGHATRCSPRPSSVPPQRLSQMRPPQGTSYAWHAPVTARPGPASPQRAQIVAGDQLSRCRRGSIRASPQGCAATGDGAHPGQSPLFRPHLHAHAREQLVKVTLP